MSDVMATGARSVQLLDGEWAFRHETDAADRIALVPMPWQANFADLRQVSGRAIYKRRFSCPEEVEGKETVLRFGAVSYLAEVRVNGVEVGSHEGGYLPFDCVIPPHLLNAVNEVEVTCLLQRQSRRHRVRRNSAWQAKLVRADWRHLAIGDAGNPRSRETGPLRHHR